MKFSYFIDQFLKFFKREDLGFSSQASALIDLKLGSLDPDPHDTALSSHLPNQKRPPLTKLRKGWMPFPCRAHRNEPDALWPN